MSEHACEWCGTGTDGKKATCGSAHRGARWRWLQGIGNDTPPWPGSPLHGRKGEAVQADTPKPVIVEKVVEVVVERVVEKAVVVAPPPGPRSGTNARSGTMLSYRKAIKATRDALHGYYDPEAADLVEKALTEALAPTQRRKLEARDAG